MKLVYAVIVDNRCKTECTGVFDSQEEAEIAREVTSGIFRRAEVIIRRTTYFEDVDFKRTMEELEEAGE